MPRQSLTLKFIVAFIGLMGAGVGLKTAVYALIGGGSSGWIGFLASTAIAGVVTGAIALVVVYRLVSPIAQLARLVDASDRAAAATLARRGDEIGRAADAVTRLWDRADEHEAQQAEALAESAARASRGERLAGAVDTFRSESASLVQALLNLADNTLMAAQKTRDTATESKARSEAVNQAARSATDSVQSVAAATEQLDAAIGEVRDGAGRVRALAAKTVDGARTSRARMTELSQALGAMTTIVGDIEAVAGQTNLLALNATIEAARAGEAGRGFAVVASEVKSLAEQTTRLTTTISERIGRLDASIREADAAAEAMTADVGEIDSASNASAASIEQQKAAVAEIAQAAQTASDLTRTVDQNGAVVAQSATEAELAAVAIADMAADLKAQAGRLSTDIERFLDDVRAA